MYSNNDPHDGTHANGPAFSIRYPYRRPSQWKVPAAPSREVLLSRQIPSIFRRRSRLIGRPSAVASTRSAIACPNNVLTTTTTTRTTTRQVPVQRTYGAILRPRNSTPASSRVTIRLPREHYETIMAVHARIYASLQSNYLHRFNQGRALQLIRLVNSRAMYMACSPRVSSFILIRRSIPNVLQLGPSHLRPPPRLLLTDGRHSSSSAPIEPHVPPTRNNSENDDVEVVESDVASPQKQVQSTEDEC